MSKIIPSRPEALRGFWEEARSAMSLPAEPAGAFAFGDSRELADELAELVVNGPKRATAGLMVGFEHDAQPVPKPGQHWIVLDGRGSPVCIIRTVEVRIGPLSSVDATFAWDEGEGDRTLASWKQAHERYFRRRCAVLGVPFSPDLETAFERFDRVWPDSDFGLVLQAEFREDRTDNDECRRSTWTPRDDDQHDRLDKS